MPDNPYSSPKTASGHESSSLKSRFGVSQILFLGTAFVSAWIVFYLAYLVNGFGYGYLSAESGIGLLTPLIWESLIVAVVVSELAALPLLANAKIALKNFYFLAAICALEFVMAYFFFVAFFEI